MKNEFQETGLTSPSGQAQPSTHKKVVVILALLVLAGLLIQILPIFLMFVLPINSVSGNISSSIIDFLMSYSNESILFLWVMVLGIIGLILYRSDNWVATGIQIIKFISLCLVIICLVGLGMCVYSLSFLYHK